MDEILPSIRKNGAYMTDNTLEQAIADPDFMIGLLNGLKEEKTKRIKAEEEKELAEKTKAWIGDKKTATAMATASVLSRKVAKLEREIEFSDTGVEKCFWRTAANIPTLKSLLKINQITNRAIGKELTKYSKSMNYKIKKVATATYTYNAYHLDVIDEFVQEIKDNPLYMEKYRKSV